MNRKIYKVIFIGSIVIFALFLTFPIIQQEVSVSESSLKKSLINTASVPINNTILNTIIVGEKTLQIKSYAGASLYDVLLSAKENGNITFSGKNYPGLGFFMTDIDSLHSEQGKYLFYYINNKEASVGVSSYSLKDGDIIKWELK